MGGNGSKASGSLNTPEGRHYHTVSEIFDNVKVLENNNPNANVKLPEESNTPGRIYIALNKPATNKKGQKDPYAGKLKSIAVYGDDCKKLYEIHVDHTHNGLKIHYHPWENGHPVKVGSGKNSPNAAFALTPAMEKILKTIKTKVPHV